MRFQQTHNQGLRQLFLMLPWHRQQLTQTLIVCWLKMHFFTPILDCEKQTEENRVIGKTWFWPCHAYQNDSMMNKKLDYSLHPSGPSGHLPGKAMKYF